MIALENIASKLSIPKNELIYNSVKSYLENQLCSVEAEIFIISKKYGINDIFDFLDNVQSGKISENIAYDDFFLLDNLTNQRDNITNAISELL